MQSNRPVNLNLFTINFPLAAIVSITHRVTGGMLFVGFGFGLYAMQMALGGSKGFAEAQVLMQTPLAKFILLGLLFVLTFHVVAGLKHLMLDFHIGDSLRASQIGSQVVCLLSIAITASLGALLW
ncbi:MAG: succinate dehydrogenase / fumarate reductase cytochrome b subunit [Limisphaerales bacterium]|jgi:succinate dehydrogenase / fumarate reductase cytochrome b subunit